MSDRNRPGSDIRRQQRELEAAVLEKRQADAERIARELRQQREAAAARFNNRGR